MYKHTEKLDRKYFGLALAAILLAGVAVFGQTTEFTYQGSLKDGAAPANANYDFEFALFDAASGGTQVGATLARNTVAVTNGIFAVKLDFGSQFPGADRYLEIRVRISGGGGLTTLSPRQLVNSAPYSVKTLNADNATTATNATNATTAQTAVNATNATTANNALSLGGVDAGRFVQKDAGGNVVVAGALTVNGIVQSTLGGIRFPDGTTQTSAATGGGSITGVTAGTGLTGGGTTGNVTVNIATGGVGTTQLADNAVTTAKLADANVTNAKIADVAGSKITGSITTATIPGTSVTGTVANAANAATATDATQLGGVAANQYLLTNGNGSGLTNLNAASIATGTLSNARLGQIPTANIADSAVTSAKIGGGQVVKGVTVGATTLTDNVTLAGSANITITPSGNTLTIASTAGGVSGGGAANSIPVWTGPTTLGNSTAITQSVNGVQLPNGVQLGVGVQGYQVSFGSPNGETGMLIAGPGAPGRADLRFGGTDPANPTLKLVVGPAGGPPASTNGIVIGTSGVVGIGTSFVSSVTKLDVDAGALFNGVSGRAANATGIGVVGSNSFGRGVYGTGTQGVVGYSGSGTGLVARSDGGVLVEGFPSASGNTRTFHINLNGTYVAGSDFAESLPTRGDKSNYEPGDVLVMSSLAAGVVEKSRRPYDARVSGVYSTRPGMLGAEKGGAARIDPGEVPVAIVGIVPTKVSAENGAVRVGDLLTTSHTPGYAMRCTNRLRCIGATIGKAMEPLKNGKGVIKVLVTLR